mgnify:CR=1 FL=1
MKNIKALPISIVTIILVVFLSVSFTVFDKSQAVSISGVAGSYAQIYAKSSRMMRHMWNTNWNISAPRFSVWSWNRNI